MVTGLIGKKVGMTQLFAADGTVSPATVLKAGPCVIAQVKTVATDGYEAVQLGFVEAKPTKENKPSAGHFKKAGVPSTRVRREVKVKAGEGDAAKPGDIVNVTIFADGERVDVIGTSKGKGFQGVIKRHHMGGKPATHGVHEYFRHGGSIGCRLTPGKVHKGKRMGGQMGNERKTVQNLKIAKVLPDEGVLLVSGSIPGGNDTIVTVRVSHKSVMREQHGAAKAAKK
jgi:large subunit ribosomal protein L3